MVSFLNLINWLLLKGTINAYDVEAIHYSEFISKIFYYVPPR
jgi:hypothetical protein